jgi:hypothetical protein
MRRNVSPDVQKTIAEAAYFLAEKQNFAPGHELENWLAAERQVLGQRLSGRTQQPSFNDSAKPSAVSQGTKTTRANKQHANKHRATKPEK